LRTEGRRGRSSIQSYPSIATSSTYTTGTTNRISFDLRWSDSKIDDFGICRAAAAIAERRLTATAAAYTLG
jgi:hypothetical protein